MRTTRSALFLAVGCSLPLIAHLALAQAPAAPPVPAVPAGSAKPTPPAATGSATTTPPAAPGSATPAPAPSAAPAPTYFDAPPVVPAASASSTADVAPPAPVASAPGSATPEPLPAPVPAPDQSDEHAKTKPPAATLGVEGMFAGTVRLGSVSSGYDSSSRAGLAYGGGLFLSPSRSWAIGLSYAYGVAARENFNPTVDDSSGSMERRLQTLAANVRIYPLRNDTIGLWGGLMLGGAWQTATVSGTSSPTQPSAVGKSYRSEGGPNGGLALGLGVGMDYDISSDVALLTSVHFTTYRLTSDLLDGDSAPLVPGIGNTSQLDLRVAFQYRFDLSSTFSGKGPNVQAGSL